MAASAAPAAPPPAAPSARRDCVRDAPPPSATLDHLLRYLSTWAGTDKALQLTQYSSKVILGLLRLAVLARLRAGTTPLSPDSPAVALIAPLTKLSALCSNARTLNRIWTTLGTVQAMIRTERTPPRSRTRHWIERVQGCSMLLYGPLEAAAYLAGHGILPLSPATQSKLWTSSSRAWAAYVILQLVKVAQDARVLAADRAALARLPKAAGEKSVELQADRAQLATRTDAVLTDAVIQLGWLPLTIHYSTEKGFLPDLVIGILGTMACSAGIRRGWAASA